MISVVILLYSSLELAMDVFRGFRVDPQVNPFLLLEPKMHENVPKINGKTPEIPNPEIFLVILPSDWQLIHTRTSAYLNDPSPRRIHGTFSSPSVPIRYLDELLQPL